MNLFHDFLKKIPLLRFGDSVPTKFGERYPDLPDVGEFDLQFEDADVLLGPKNYG